MQRQLVKHAGQHRQQLIALYRLSLALHVRRLSTLT